MGYTSGMSSVRMPIPSFRLNADSWMKDFPTLSLWRHSAASKLKPRALSREPSILTGMKASICEHGRMIRGGKYTDRRNRRASEDSILAVQIFDQKKFKKKDQGFLGVINVRVGDVIELSTAQDDRQYKLRLNHFCERLT
jgi:hypothetical protein